ncbi:MAG: V/A-type H+/Na+-transporting ATPase subunit [Tepidanaerobacteraceae bacterium]|nr:V/A-type H+/Na+-transporting ATPase subunit [Tepidanaerobacteraceae bacterium]
MAVEKMKIVGVIGKNSLLSRVLRLVVLNGSMHVINALVRVNSSDFFLPPSEKNIEALEELPFLKPYSSKRDFSHDEEVVTSLLNLFGITPRVKLEHLGQDYDYDEFIKKLSDIHEKVRSKDNEIKERMRSIEKKREYIESLRYLAKYGFDMGRLTGMKYLAFRLLKITRENYDKLKKNYENIPAVVIKVAAEGKYVIVASITPVSLEETVEKIFSSLNHTLLPLPEGCPGTASSVIEDLTKSIDEDQKAIDALKTSLEDYRVKFAEEFEKGFSRLEMEKKVEELKTELAVGDRLFFMFGFVPTSSVPDLKNALESQFREDIIVLVDDINGGGPGITPPTKLSNSKLFRPFETLVKMYGTPAYNEKDPTVFFGLTYMLLFGAMFGDVGQGLVLLLAGLFLELVAKRTGLGGVLSRIGLSSTVFGFIYGSVFGSEEIIPPLVVRPMANINFMLVAAVVFGIVLIMGGYIYNIVNSRLEGNIEEGLFGRNGVAGLAFYMTLLYTASRAALAGSGVSPALVFTMAGLLLLMVFKQPLTARLTHSDKLYKGSPADYYIEEGFGVIETLLSMVSNTISFIRVGAFALNHVGLYVAFATMGEMMGSAWEDVVILVIGNIIIIGLEGLIVFIQALRLEYYELFTRYFRGDGVEYLPARLKYIPRASGKMNFFRNFRISREIGTHIFAAL